MSFPYHITAKEFTIENTSYSVALSAELYPDDEGLDFTGAIVGLLIDEKRGTINFRLEPQGEGEWLCTAGSLTEGVAKQIISIYHGGKPFEFNSYGTQSAKTVDVRHRSGSRR